MSVLTKPFAQSRSAERSGANTRRSHKKLKPVEHQTIVLVGASSGMGRTTALEAAKRGARVVVAARNEEALNELVKEIEQRGGKAIAVTADVSNFEDVQRIATVAQEHF